MARIPKTERSRKSPGEKAQQALDVAQRAVDKLLAKRKTLTAQLDAIKPELAAAEKRRDYLAQSPDLPSQAREDDELPATDPSGDPA